MIAFFNIAKKFPIMCVNAIGDVFLLNVNNKIVKFAPTKDGVHHYKLPHLNGKEEKIINK